MADQPQLADEVRKLVEALSQWAVASVTDRLGSVTRNVTQAAGGGGGDSGGALTSAVSSAVGGGLKGGAPGALKEGAKGAVKGVAGSAKEALTGGGGGGGGSSEVKVTNIVESIDIGVPVRAAYNLWTEYAEFPNYTKGVESVEVDDEEQQEVEWKAHVAFSHRTWQATVTEQVPDKRIVWTSKGNKGFVDGAVTFHELAPELTRILVVLEYHPQGFVEWVANRWRAAGRRVRLDLKHFRRHAMTRTLLDPEEVDGWRGEIRDGEVVKDHETALREERDAEQQDREEPEVRDEGGAEQDREDEDRDEEPEEPRSRAGRGGHAGDGSEDQEDQDEEPGAPRARTARRGRSRDESEDRSGPRRPGARREGARGRRTEQARKRSEQSRRRAPTPPRRRSEES